MPSALSAITDAALLAERENHARHLEVAASDLATVESYLATSRTEVLTQAVRAETAEAEVRRLSDLLYPLPLAQPVAAERIRLMCGVQDFLTYGGLYADAAENELDVSALGVGFIRHSLKPIIPDGLLDRINSFGAKGIKSYLTIGEPRAVLNVGERIKIEGYLSRIAGSAVAICGWNEPNNVRGSGGSLPTDWPERCLDHQAWVYSLGYEYDIEVVGPALHAEVNSHDNDVRRLGALGIGDYMDVIGMHLYPKGKMPLDRRDDRAALYRQHWGVKPIDINETGYFTDLTSRLGNPVSPDVQGVYTPRMVLSNALAGMRTCVFELYDSAASGREDTLGIIDFRGNWKPGYTELARLLNGLRDPGGEQYVAAPLGLKVEGPKDLLWLVTGKMDGSRQLHMWLNVPVWNPATKSTVPVARDLVTVTTAKGERVVEVGARVVTVTL